MKNRTLLIIKGYAGAGKTTAAHGFALEHDSALLSQDVFEFDFNPAAEVTRKILPIDGQIGFKNLLSVLENYMSIPRAIVLEGALVKCVDDAPFNFSEILKLAKKHKYKIVLITLVADEKVRRARQENCDYILPLELDRELAKLTDDPPNSLKNRKIDTTKMGKEQVVAAINEIVLAQEK